MIRPGAVRLGALAEAIGARVHGDPELAVVDVASLADATEQHLTFFNSPKYRSQLDATASRAVIVSEEALPAIGARSALVCANPYLGFARAATFFHPPARHAEGIDPRAVIEEGAEVDPSATVMAFAYVGRGAKLGARAVLYPHVFVGEGSVIGADALLYPGVVVREGCTVGDRAILHAGAVLGADGFGFAFDPAGPSGPRHYKIPQFGTVDVGPDVEVGANTAIDRAAMGATRVGAGTKIDNLVQLGHNVEVGPLCLLCGQVGIAGSAKLGTGVVAGGQAGIAGHLAVADGVRIGAQSGVLSALDEPGEYLGSPAIKSRTFMRAQVQMYKGPELAKEVRALRERLEKLEALLAK